VLPRTTRPSTRSLRPRSRRSYLESNFTELENVLAEHLGLEKTQRRLLAILREDCTPRLGIRARLWLDMTDDEEFETNLARLVYELRSPADG
jgi:hypothetical protein